MKENLTRALGRLRERFQGFSVGQKLAATAGVLALVLGVVMVARWATTPTYSPLFSQLDSADASAVIDELNASGVPHQLSDGGQTIAVPKEQVYSTRIALSGKGLPASSDGGYSLLDNQSLSTSQFQEETSFKRAMEGELASTIEAIEGVTNAVVHLAIPSAKVFATEQEPASASVLIATQRGKTFTADQVQAVVHLVASSIEGLEPDKVTVADSTGKVLSNTESTDGSSGSSTRSQAVLDYQEELNTKIQRTLDTVLGPGNSTVAVTANLDFDKSVRTSTTYNSDPDSKPRSQSESEETYSGSRAGAEADGGVVGAGGNTEQDVDNSDGSYSKRSATQDNALNSVVEQREAAPGSVRSLHIGVAMDANADVDVSAGEMRDLIAAAIGEDLERGDTVEVTSVPFDRSARESAEAELRAAEEADAQAARNALLRNIGIGALVFLAAVAAWLVTRRRARARVEATEYVVEQLRMEAEARAAAQAAAASAAAATTNPALAILETTETDEVEKMRDELTNLVERQPEDVAALLRGWLVEPTR